MKPEVEEAGAAPAGPGAPELPGAVPEEFFRLAVETSPVGTLVADRAGRIVLVNAQVEWLFGYKRSELLGKPVEMLVPERLRARHPGLREDFWSGPHARPMGAGQDLFGLRKDGTEVPIEIGLNPLTTSAGKFILGSIVDMTDSRRAAEQFRASLQEKETLLKEVHHRVKNNLQVISSLLSIQSRSVEDPRAAAMLLESQNRVHSIALVHEKLYEAGDLGRVDFGNYMQALGDHLQSAWAGAEERISIAVEAAGLLLPLDVAIPCGLIVNELVTNAFKHAFPGGRSGAVKVRASMEPDGSTLLAVEDDGVGIPEMKAARRGAGGTMGMMLVWTLARQIGAEVAVTVQGGTRVQLRFRVGR
jgi:two-component system, sensor histidine kinase PdtaS